MNIFKILANGGGNISETNVSAFLGYILDSSADHGLGDRFLNKFLTAIDESNNEIVESKVFYEQKLKDGLKDFKITDLVIVGYSIQRNSNKQSMLLDFISSKKKVTSIIPIEVKINKKSHSKKQLVDQYNQLRNSLSMNKNSQMNIDTPTMVYITPNNKTFINEFEKTTSSIKGKCKHVFWDYVKNKASILTMLDAIFKEEATGEENPLNQYTLTTLKAFKSFIQNGFSSQKQEDKNNTRELYPSLPELLAKHPSIINTESQKIIVKLCDHIVNMNNQLISYRHAPGHPLSIFLNNKKIFGFKRYGDTIKAQLLFGPFKSYKQKMNEFKNTLTKNNIAYKDHTEKILLLIESNDLKELIKLFDEMIDLLQKEDDSSSMSD